MDPEWARDLRDTCNRLQIPFLFKQFGAHNEKGERVGKHAAGRVLDGRTWDEYPVPRGHTIGLRERTKLPVAGDV